MHGSGAAPLWVDAAAVDVIVDAGVDAGVDADGADAALDVGGCDVGGCDVVATVVAGGVTLGRVELVSATGVAALRPSTARAVSATSKRRATTEPSTRSRRRQYTDGGREPTGCNMSRSR